MNIETSSNAATAIFQKSELTGSSRMQRTNSSSKSFEDELKTAADEKTSTAEENDTELKEDDTDKVTSKTDDKKTENKDNKIENTRAEEDSQNENSGNSQNNQNGQNQQTLQGEISTSDLMNIKSGNYASLSDEVKAYLQANGGMFGFNVMQATSRAEITGFAASVDYTNIQMSDSDALFFSNLVKNTDMSGQSIAGELQKALDAGNIQQVQSSAKASAALIAALQESAKTNQPFRIDFDKDVSVIIKVDKEGKINANFIPGDKAVENYLRNNIEFLKNRFTEENIAYGDVNYSKSKQDKEEQKKQNNKENDHE